PRMRLFVAVPLPESAGADPGPACYGKGNLVPTVTDADVVKALDLLREQRADFAKVERGLANGDVAVVNYSGTSEGKPLTEIAPTAQGLTAQQGFWVEMKPDSFIPGFAQQLIEQGFAILRDEGVADQIKRDNFTPLSCDRSTGGASNSCQVSGAGTSAHRALRRVARRQRRAKRHGQKQGSHCVQSGHTNGYRGRVNG
ncbi:MAG: hypothetical protein HC779_02495, partial [Phyllobacteriaceae bacterium]|nr:hypothetical protein [Phyllobacteriaceae bacterium]